MTDSVLMFLVADGDWFRRYANEVVVTKCRVKQYTENFCFQRAKRDRYLHESTLSLSDVF